MVKLTRKKVFTYEFEQIALTVDAVLFGLIHGEPQVLLVKRSDPPRGWALPGGYVRVEETLDQAVQRKLHEETGLHVPLQRFYVADDPKRDLRKRTVSVVYYAIVRPEDLTIRAGKDADRVEWGSLTTLPRLCFDHQDLVKRAIERMRSDILEKPVLSGIFPDTFTLSQVRVTCECLLGTPLDPSNFRRDYLKKEFLETVTTFGKTPSQMYRFKKQGPV